MLQLRPSCECCDSPLPPDSTEAPGQGVERTPPSAPRNGMFASFLLALFSGRDAGGKIPESAGS
jgi:hypothetical protein